MKRIRFLYAAVILLTSYSAVWADLAWEFTGFNYVQENKVSGLQSSNGATKLPGSMFTLGPDCVTYPGVGQVPSPGGSVGRHFDEGALGVKVQGGNLIVRVAGGLDPVAGYYYSGWDTWYGQGDVFITVDDSSVSGVKNFALLSSWPSYTITGGKTYRTLDGGYFDSAQTFHTGLDALAGDGSTMEGNLVLLGSASDVLLTGGAGSYDRVHYSANGLDYRVFAQGGTNIGNAGLAHTSTTDKGIGNVDQTWYIETWTVPLSWLSSDSVFDIGLHKAPSCGNDQIGLLAEVVVPVPAAVLLGLLGLGAAGVKLRKYA